MNISVAQRAKTASALNRIVKNGAKGLMTKRQLVESLKDGV